MIPVTRLLGYNYPISLSPMILIFPSYLFIHLIRVSEWFESCDVESLNFQTAKLQSILQTDSSYFHFYFHFRHQNPHHHEYDCGISYIMISSHTNMIS